MIAILSERIERRGVKNVTTEVSSAYEIPLPSNSVDRVLMVHVLPEIPDKQKALRQIGRVLTKEGLLTLAERLIDPDHRRRKTETSWCRDTGFELTGSYGSFFF